MGMNRRKHAISLLQATQESPTLARLSDLAAASSARLQAVQALIPATLRATVQAGPIEADAWCILVGSTAAAAKLRQLLPAMEAHLRSSGLAVTSIRLKVRPPAPR